MPPPEAASPLQWTRFSTEGLHCICRVQLEKSLREIYESHPWVYDAIRAHASSDALRGRRPVAAGRLGGLDVVVKRLHHGGSLARLWKDRFLTPHRIQNHIELAEHLDTHGIATPRVLFVAWRRVRGFVRGEVGFERIEGGIDADRHLFENPELPPDWRESCERIGRLVARLHRAHFLHADLNLMNFYFAPGDRTFILDLDKTVLGTRPLSEPERQRNLARLIRSIYKQGREHDVTKVDAIVARVSDAYRKALSFALLAGSILSSLPALV